MAVIVSISKSFSGSIYPRFRGREDQYLGIAMETFWFSGKIQPLKLFRQHHVDGLINIISTAVPSTNHHCLQGPLSPLPPPPPGTIH